MTAREKAEELVDKFLDEPLMYGMDEDAKRCAIIAVDTVLIALNEYDINVENYVKGISSYQQQNMERDWSYWDAVKKEINNLFN